MRYTARAPLRIDFGGGWTDVPIYAEREGGAVLNAAITRYVTGMIARPETHGLLHALRGDRSYVSYQLDLPVGAGLGASAAQTVLWVTLVKTTIANVSERRDIAEIACQIGGLLGIMGGKQDEYASALGGITYYTFGDTVHAQHLNLDSSLADELRSRLVLVYTGTPRMSGTIHERVWGRYERAEPSVVGALATLKRVAGDMRDALAARDLDAFADLLNENWESQKALDTFITNDRLDEIFDFAARHGARGGKACGAGGGGCAVFLAARGDEDRLREAFRSRKLQIVDFDFDTYGVFLSKR